MTDADFPRSSAVEMLRSIAPDGLCKACIGVAFKLSTKALEQELDVLSRAPSYNYRRGRCYRCRATTKRVVLLIQTGL